MIAVPDYLKDHGTTGLEEAVRYVVPPRVKIIEGLTTGPLAEQFRPGDVVVTPNNLRLAEMPYHDGRSTDRGTPFSFVPLFFFAEWCTWNPRGSAQAIADRTIDPTHEIAAKAQNPKLRQEQVGTDAMGKPTYIRHCEHLCFVIKPDAGILAGVPLLLSFLRGEHRAGSNFIGLARMRKAALYSMRFQASVVSRLSNDNTWFGLDVINPVDPVATPPWVSEQEVETNRAMYQDLHEAHEKNLIRVDYDEDQETAVPGDTVDGRVVQATGEF